MVIAPAIIWKTPRKHGQKALIFAVFARGGLIIF
jgi:hypothetical protein